jgi:hypothetical protein
MIFLFFSLLDAVCVTQLKIANRVPNTKSFVFEGRPAAIL